MHPAAQQAATPRFIRLPEVKHLTGLSRATIYRLAKAGRFPSARKPTQGIAVWLDTEVRSWMAQAPGPAATAA